MEVKQSIKKIRKAKGYSQQQIADKLQTTQQQYSKYETGEQEIPTRHIITLSKLYNVTANKLLGIDTFMTEKEDQTKFEKLYKTVEEIIEWAAHQGHITDDGVCALMQNIYQEKERIEQE